MHEQANRAVKHLVLLGNMIGDVGVGLIADALTVNTTLLTLDLSRNFIRREVRKEPEKELELELRGDVVNVVWMLTCQ